ncbi:porin [Pasteurellaceae bacterium 22721_9_1]
MKKTLVALAVAVAATSASAATVYNQNGAKVDIDGSVRVFLGKEGKEQRGDLRNDGSRLIVNASQDLGNGFGALAGLQLRFDETKDKNKNTFGDVRVEDLFAGFSYENLGTLTFGRQATNSDDVQLVDYTYRFGGNNNLTDHADKSVKFRSAEWSGFSFGVDYLFGNADKKAEGGKYGYGVAAFYTRDLAEGLTFNLNAGYTVDREESVGSSKTTAKTEGWRVASEVVYGPFSFGAEYGQSREKEGHDVVGKSRFVEVGAKYQVTEPSAVYLQWQRNEDVKDSVQNVYIAGVDYKFNKNVVTYVEYAHAKTHEYVPNAEPNKSKENKFGVGLRVFF